MSGGGVRAELVSSGAGRRRLYVNNRSESTDASRSNSVTTNTTMHGTVWCRDGTYCCARWLVVAVYPQTGRRRPRVVRHFQEFV